MSLFLDEYNKIILEAQFDNINFTKQDSYKNIDIYINLIHVKQRLLERYNNKKLSDVKDIIKRFLKEIISERILVDDKINNRKFDVPYTIYAKFSIMYISGRFKWNYDTVKKQYCWRIYISTILPGDNPTFNKTDYFKEVKI